VRVLVTGATGFIGRALVPRLQRNGHSIVAWVRSDTRAMALLGADVDIVSEAFAALSRTRIDLSAPIRTTVVGRPTDAYWRVHDPEIAAGVDRAAATLAAAGIACDRYGGLTPPNAFMGYDWEQTLIAGTVDWLRRALGVGEA